MQWVWGTSGLAPSLGDEGVGHMLFVPVKKEKLEASTSMGGPRSAWVRAICCWRSSRWPHYINYMIRLMLTDFSMGCQYGPGIELEFTRPFFDPCERLGLGTRLFII